MTRDCSSLRPASAARAWSPEVLEEELGRVHAREFARLLCRAALLRLEPRLPLALGLADDHLRWLRDARRARALAVVDGYEPAGLLRHALAHAPEEWPPAASLVREALALDSAEDVRWHAAALAWFEGRADARAGLVELAEGAARELWRARARILLEQGECKPW